MAMQLFLILTALMLLTFLPTCLFGENRPDVQGQKEAMRKLSFLVGDWMGKATARFGPGEPVQIEQTEEVGFRLDGLVLLIEGTGRDAAGKIVFNALGTIAYDPQTKSYRLRAYRDGNYIDTELKVEPDAFEWGYTSGAVTVRNAMKLDAQGRWNETTTIRMPDGRTMRTMDMALTKKSSSQR